MIKATIFKSSSLVIIIFKAPLLKSLIMIIKRRCKVYKLLNSLLSEIIVSNKIIIDIFHDEISGNIYQGKIKNNFAIYIFEVSHKETKD